MTPSAWSARCIRVQRPDSPVPPPLLRVRHRRVTSEEATFRVGPVTLKVLTLDAKGIDPERLHSGHDLPSSNLNQSRYQPSRCRFQLPATTSDRQGSRSAPRSSGSASSNVQVLTLNALGLHPQRLGCEQNGEGKNGNGSSFNRSRHSSRHTGQSKTPSLHRLGKHQSLCLDHAPLPRWWRCRFSSRPHRVEGTIVKRDYSLIWRFSKTRDRRSIIQYRNAFDIRRLGNGLQIGINIGQFLIGDHLGGIGRHLSSGMSHIFREVGPA